MENNNDKIWLAAYLYYGQPWEEFLAKAVKPIVEEIMNKKWAEQFFFIRYWEKGPHIRLRFKGDSELLESSVKPLITSHFEKFFKENPSERTEPGQELSEENKWYPNNSIQFIEYEPEVERYAGPKGIKVAEKQFMASSKATLEIINNELKDWDYNRALGTAIQKHLAFAYAMDMNLDEATLFFSRFFENWLPRAYYFFEQNISKEELDKRKEETLNAFKINFDNQKEAILPFCQTAWDAFGANEEFDTEWLNNWIEDIKEVRQNLNELHQEGELVTPKWYRIDDNSPAAKEQQELWAIYDSYIHMINNRLGIMNRDEGYLAYLLRESLIILSNQSVKES